ncbi:Cytosolic sulfotransferase 15 [Linum grandiflorum]
MVSQLHFFNRIFGRSQDPMPLKRAAEIFCSGVTPFGPFYKHVIEYWEESKRSPEKVMFIKYEDLRGPDTKLHVRELASFIGRPFVEDDD